MSRKSLQRHQQLSYPKCRKVNRDLLRSELNSAAMSLSTKTKRKEIKRVQCPTEIASQHDFSLCARQSPEWIGIQTPSSKGLVDIEYVQLLFLTDYSGPLLKSGK